MRSGSGRGFRLTGVRLKQWPSSLVVQRPILTSTPRWVVCKRAAILGQVLVESAETYAHRLVATRIAKEIIRHRPERRPRLITHKPPSLSAITYNAARESLLSDMGRSALGHFQPVETLRRVPSRRVGREAPIFDPLRYSMVYTLLQPSNLRNCRDPSRVLVGAL